jgi:competence protein ComEA
VEPSGAPWRVLEPVESTTPDTAEPRPGQRPIPWPAVAAAALVASVAIAAFLLAGRSDPVIGVDGATGLGPSFGLAESSADPALGGGPELVVEVGGAVTRPGVYRLPPGSRVGDAIVAAGGFGAGVDAAAADRQLNLAAMLRDGDEVRVPTRGEAAATGGGGGEGDGGGGGLIDVNSASAEQLDTLPGIGPATAAKIIAAREEQRFASVDDLRARKVVGEATLEKIRDLVTVGP